MKKLMSFLRCESGASSIEYAMLALGIGIVVIVTVNSLGASVDADYVAVSDALDTK